MSSPRIIEGKIDRLARALRLKSKRIRSNYCEIDRVWFFDVPVIGLVPVLSFEVESKPKGLKYYKGDFLNIQTQGTHGAIVLGNDAFGSRLGPTRKKIEELAKRTGHPVRVIYESEIDEMLDLLKEN